MRIMIIYYSFSGNTRKVAQTLGDFLRRKNHRVDIQRLVPKRESKIFLVQVKQALMHKDIDLQPGVLCDLSDWDMIFLGSPVWAFFPVPAVRKYMKLVKNCQDKKFFLFVTYGSGLGRFRCLNDMETLVKKKGGEVVGKLDISDKKVRDCNYLNELFEEKIKL